MNQPDRAPTMRIYRDRLHEPDARETGQSRGRFLGLRRFLHWTS